MGQLVFIVRKDHCEEVIRLEKIHWWLKLSSECASRLRLEEDTAVPTGL
jgi:hypothetical protein